MRLFDLKENDHQLDELLPTMAAVAPAAGQVAQPVALGTQPAAGLATGQMDPAQAAQAAKQRNEQKKQIQDAIKTKQKELSDLQKQLAQLG